MDATPNPITELRRRHGISPETLGAVFDLPLRVMRALEMNGRLVPPETLEHMEREVTRWLQEWDRLVELREPGDPLPPLILRRGNGEGGGDA